MVPYWVQTPKWLKKLFPKELHWDMPVDADQSVYITFDDGPHPIATPFVLEQLTKHDAKATFFCVGNNVSKHPEIYEQVTKAGHTTANHTFDHVNGLKTDNEVYFANIEKASTFISSKLFRPPYGRIKMSQAKKLIAAGWQIYMWDVLSADFDRTISPQQCLDNVLKHIRPGTIIIFHDSEKAWERMNFALPHVLAHCRAMNWKMKALPH